MLLAGVLVLPFLASALRLPFRCASRNDARQSSARPLPPFQPAADLVCTAEIAVNASTRSVRLDTVASALWLKPAATSPSYDNDQEPTTLANDAHAFSSATIELAGAKLNDQLILSLDDHDALPPSVDGGLGLAPSDYPTSHSPTPRHSLLHNMFTRNPSMPRLVTFSLSRNHPEGLLSIGEYEPKYANAVNVRSIPMFASDNVASWRIVVEAILTGSANTYVLASSSLSSMSMRGAVAMLDISASHSFVPKQISDAIYGQIPGAHFQSESGYWQLPCSNHAHLTLQISGRLIPIRPLDLMLPSNEDPDVCVGSIRPISEGTERTFDWIIGQNLLRSTYTILQYGDPDGDIKAHSVKLVPLVDFNEAFDGLVEGSVSSKVARGGRAPPTSPWVVLLPLLLVLSTFLFLLLLFLVCVVLLRRKRGISLRDDGPTDLSRDDFDDSDGALESVESNWLESVDEVTRRSYIRARDYQLQCKPNSLPTDITLSQFLSIQEKGVSAWSFEPDFETVNSLLVHARTEITFLPDPASSSSVQSNLPLPKLNEVYYWEVKMFDLPESTSVAVGLATKPYPAFRMPGLNKFSVAYHSSGDKSHNYPFTATSFGPPLKEGDVLGIGYRPRTGTVFFTRNGRKMEDAYTGLSRWNLFPTIGADGPCSVHVNLGQAGFVFIEANVKKWGLAPSVGTLAPPPAYGSERGSILLDVGGRRRSSAETTPQNTPGASSPASPPSTPTRRSHRSRRPNHSGAPVASSPLRQSNLSEQPMTPPPPITPIDEHPDELGAGPATSGQGRYMSPTDRPFHIPPNNNLPASVDSEEEQTSGMSSPSSSRSRSLSPDRGANPFITPRRERHSLTHMAASLSEPGSELTVQVHPPPDSPSSPMSLNPPTPNLRDIHLQALNHRRTGSSGSQSSDQTVSPPSTISRRDPPAYSPLDAYTYADGVQIDLPAEVITAALEGDAVPNSAVGQGSSSERRRSSRRH